MRRRHLRSEGRTAFSFAALKSGRHASLLTVTALPDRPRRRQGAERSSFLIAGDPPRLVSRSRCGDASFIDWDESRTLWPSLPRTDLHDMPLRLRTVRHRARRWTPGAGRRKQCERSTTRRTSEIAARPNRHGGAVDGSVRSALCQDFGGERTCICSFRTDLCVDSNSLAPKSICQPQRFASSAKYGTSRLRPGRSRSASRRAIRAPSGTEATELLVGIPEVAGGAGSAYLGCIVGPKRSVCTAENIKGLAEAQHARMETQQVRL
ncbi:hypothetical protein ACVIWU_006428 [Bradyrhizobium sp. USDA 4509]